MTAAEIARLRENANRADAREWCSCADTILALLTALEQSQAALADVEIDLERQNHATYAVLVERDALRARLEAAREALKPFAEYACWVAENHPGWDHDDFNVALPGAFRRARAAIAEMEGK